MALTQLNQLQIAFKKLLGKSHTSPKLGIANENLPSFIQLGSTTLFADPIPSSGLPSNLYETSSGAIIEKVRFELVSFGDGGYTPTNGTSLSNTTVNAESDESTFPNGNHTFILKLSGSYNSRSNNPKKGTAPFTDGYFLTGSGGALQLIPPAFGGEYTATLYNTAGVIIPSLSPIDWVLDYSTGVLYAQDAPTYAITPGFIEGYIYIGRYLSDDKTAGYSGSFSGSFQGDGTGLTNVPASGIVGLNLTRIATPDITSSVQNSSNIFTVTSASQEVFNISNQGILSGSGANLFDIPADGIVGLNLTRISNSEVTASVDTSATSFIIKSGSSTLMTVNSNGKIAVSKSINLGVPDSNEWENNLNGSYFNRFKSTDDVSEFLRFVAGLLSASAPDASPNGRSWSSTNINFSVGGNLSSKTSYMTGVLSGLTNARLSQEWNQSNAIDLNLTGSYRNLQTYLINKGWMDNSETGSQVLHDVGTHPFGISTYGTRIPSNFYIDNFSNFTFNASSVAAGNTVFSSSIAPTTFNLGSLINRTTVTPYSASIILTQSFSDTASILTPIETSTYTTSSNIIYTLASPSINGTNGLFLGIIQTVSPLVIPNSFQDGKFANVQAGYNGRKWGNTGTTSNVTSSIGYYRFHNIQVGLKTGSQSTFTYQSPASTFNAFYMPPLDLLGVTNITRNEPTVSILGNTAITAFTATSRSLSGAPYILNTTYTIEYNTEVSKSFDPCYGNSETPLFVSKTDGWSAIGSTNLSDTLVSVTINGVQTSTTKAGVFPAGSNPTNKRIPGTIPSIGDVAFASSSYTFGLSTSIGNTVPSRSIQETTNYDLSFTTTGRNWKDASATSTTSNLSFYNATRFGQPSASGSMAIYSTAQSTVIGSLTGTTEEFKGEDFRIQLDDNIATFTGNAWNTSTVYYNLGGKDLQVKPGFLVRPGGAFGYWITDPNPAESFKYYVRKFRRAGSVGSFTINAGKALTAWGDTSGTDTISIAVIFESAKASGGNNCKLYDITLSNGPKTPATFNSSSVGTNPFTSNNLDHYGAGGGSSGTTYTITMVTGDGMVLNGGSGTDEFYVVVRYKGNPNPITSLIVS